MRVGNTKNVRGNKNLIKAKEEAQEKILEHVRNGVTVAEALRLEGRTMATWERWRKTDPEFATRVDKIRSVKKLAKGPRKDFTFGEFSERFLGARVFPHMQNVVDLIEGREPGWQHASMIYQAGEPDLLVVNMPPEHSKTVTLTINYSTYRIATNPNSRIIVVSKTQVMAKRMLLAIKNRLTHPKYEELTTYYAPDGGFDGNSESWTQTQIYVSGDLRDSGEKDPTVQALGIGGQIYGSRADLIILDDCVDNTNAHNYQDQIHWIQTEVMSRLSPGGALLVVGTRLASKDLYSELLSDDYYPEEGSPWTYFAMPAVLEFGETPEDWLTLWPKSNLPEVAAKGVEAMPDDDGLYPKWDGPRLFKRRARMTPGAWARVYQQQHIAGDEIFKPEAVRATVNGNRLPGLIPNGMANCRENGMDGLVVVAGLDPASPSGFVAAVVIGLDIVTQKRYVLDVFNRTGQKPDDIRDLIKAWTDKYRVREWRIEKNAFQTMLTQDREINDYVNNAGSFIREHHTNSNKWDDDFGVASLTALFQGWEGGSELIELPSSAMSEQVRALLEQLVTWHPGASKKQKTDAVMALWFAELACRDRITAMSRYQRTHVPNPFLTQWDMSRRGVVPIGA